MLHLQTSSGNYIQSSWKNYAQESIHHCVSITFVLLASGQLGKPRDAEIQLRSASFCVLPFHLWERPPVPLSLLIPVEPQEEESFHTVPISSLGLSVSC